MYKMSGSLIEKSRTFSITIGLREQEVGGVTHTLEEFAEVIRLYLEKCANAGEPFLTGSVRSEIYIHAWGRVGVIKPPGAHLEPRAVFEGDLNALPNDGTQNQVANTFIMGLAETLCEKFSRPSITVKFNDWTYTLTRE